MNKLQPPTKLQMILAVQTCCTLPQGSEEGNKSITETKWRGSQVQAGIQIMRKPRKKRASKASQVSDAIGQSK
jgi:hypothetical protein